MKSVFIHKGDRLPVWALVRDLNMPEHKVIALLDRLELPVMIWPNGERTTSKDGFRRVLLAAVGLPVE
ncbi:hypothetical protein [Nocardia sp. NPDC002869]|uniref:hypothetical protein n=1 Tax=Nocardia sp. NPDC002869 TaxID=3161032 RepID=UPI00398D5F40